MEKRNKPTTIGQRYPHFLDRILKLFNVNSENDLPPVWQMMANLKRGGEPLATLTKTQAGIKADHLELEHTHPSISVPMELSLKNFKLGGIENFSNIDLGILSFMVTSPGATSEEGVYRQDAKDNAMLDYGMLSDLTNGLTLTDARKI